MEIEKIRKRMNFRELGGYRTSDGRKVKHGLFFRCGALGDLNEEEMQILENLGIHTIYDFRGYGEAESYPDPVPEGTVYRNLPAMKGESRSKDDGDMSPAAMQERMVNLLLEPGADAFFKETFYGNLGFSDAYQEMFEDLKKGNVPVLFHCSAGKDRTGIAGILILLALGVDYETAMSDYLKTNEYRTEQIEALRKRAAHILEEYPETEERMMSFEGVRRENADYTFEKVLERYGTFEKYFEEQYGLNEEGLNALREMYTEH